MKKSEIIAALGSGATLEEKMYACMESYEMPQTHFTAWVGCLQELYDTFDSGAKPSLADFAQAAYTVWTNPTEPLTKAIDARVSYENLIQGLTNMKESSTSVDAAFVAADITPEVNNFYMQVVITLDTAGAILHYDQTGNNDVNNYITLSDNHPDHSTGENTFELNDEDLKPNMTIHWQIVATDGTTVITLTEFQQRNLMNWTDLASLPVISGNTCYSRAHSTLPSNTRTCYAFFFTIAGCSVTFLFDPYIGDRDAN